MGKTRTRNRDFGKGDWKSYFRLIPYIRLPWIAIAVAFIVEMGYSEVMAYVPVSTSALFSGEFTGKALGEAVVYNVLNFALMFGSLILTSWVSSAAVRRAQDTLWGRMLRLDMAYYDTRDPANLMSTLTNDTETAVKSLISQLVSLIPAVYYLVKVCLTLNSYDWRLLISVLILIPLNVVYVVVLGRWQYEVNAGIFGRIGKLTAYLAERVSNIYLIRSYTNEKKEDLAGNVMEVLQRGVPVVFGMILLKHGIINMQQWIAFFLFMGQIITKINNLVGVWGGIKSAQGSAARMVEILKAKEEPQKRTDGRKTVEDGDLAFQNVRFAYGEKEVLHGVSVTVPQGKTTALVGRCGSGKTTLLSLIERLYTPSEGSISIGDTNITDYDLCAYRDHFAYVQQDAGIFGGTFRSAMTYGIDREVSDAELEDVARQTGLWKLIETLPDGFDAGINISGTSVSGGQRQRIVLARELLKQKPVMLLDEPTSALDAMSAMNIQQMIIDLFPGKTKLMITHDLRMLAQVDNVIFMEDGRVKDSGSPEELMQRCEAYRTLVLCDEEVCA